MLLHGHLAFSIFVLGLLFVPSTFIVDFSTDTRCRTLYAVNRVHVCSFDTLWNARTPFITAEVPRTCTWTRMTNDHGESIGYWHAMYARGYINESHPRGRILREYETLMDRCVFADGNEWPMAACRFILDERFCRGGYVEGTP